MTGEDKYILGGQLEDIFPNTPSVGYGREGEARGRYILVNPLAKPTVHGRLWEVVFAPRGDDEEYEVFAIAASDDAAVNDFRAFQVEWAPPHVQDLARRELFPGLAIDEESEGAAGSTATSGKPGTTESGNACEPWARFSRGE